MPVASNFAPNSQFNRRAFAWGQSGSAPAAGDRPPPVKTAKEAPKEEEECTTRIYEVVSPTGVVRAEPHIGAKMKTKKTRGGRVICSGMTMNGWLKLENEQGFLITNLRGVDDTGEVAVPVEGNPIQLAVPRYQHQGMCCLEVVSRSGVPVRDAPSRNAKTLQTRKFGEYVFAQVQNFDGWVKLAGEDGWMLAFSPEWGKLLRRRRNVNNVDLWALCDAWAVARKRPGRSLGLNAKDVEALKELEQRMLINAEAQFEEHVASGNAEKLVADGLLAQSDLTQTESWVRQRLFAHILAQTVQDGEAWLKDLLPNFKLSTRMPPLPIEEEEDDDDDEPETPIASGAGAGSVGGLRRGFFNGGRGGAPDTSDPTFEGTQPFEYNGRVFAMAPNGVIFDPPNQVPMGIWNQQTRRIDPAAGMVPGCPYAAISYWGKTYYLMPDEKLIDPETEAVVGVFNRETSQLELIDPGAAGLPQDEVPIYDPVLDDGEPVDVHEYLERGHQMAKVGRYKAAACLYGEALKGCGQQRSVDLEFECEILRARAACWSQLGSHSELLEDAERILSFSDKDREARDWKRLAVEGLRGPRSAPMDRKFGAKCTQCNGIASKCSKCGAGMDSCAHCGQPVGRSNCCSRCHTTYYCGRECQRAHWKIHKSECRSGEE